MDFDEILCGFEDGSDTGQFPALDSFVDGRMLSLCTFLLAVCV